ncbi:hypothetical protein [Tuwongella immobilis]|uniref:Uncharacterized protein n=1 Tax=Tuwongella immobilis TaxID=692036 RepID=A0A6C2YH59_9BACT|nr:hypothetical protein [Tuwongella immobilis]VIP00858.1 Uncharacterized protein OS=Isosphaera pallida (strain ATCC 43644 / DSM 9630 / IS1B) GN=Isop_3392 PE=4 SV=1 [Tuwongella immobilis]VTR97134.1 Uncharacterized protein OS=Isosphaera pallida (strain ATCC 43644 / DSM 9630 / IS1B) GN=Isop_3392 PE=4 SV=1 [Tuwongella immobilis]
MRRFPVWCRFGIGVGWLLSGLIVGLTATAAELVLRDGRRVDGTLRWQSPNTRPIDGPSFLDSQGQPIPRDAWDSIQESRSQPAPMAALWPLRLHLDQGDSLLVAPQGDALAVAPQKDSLSVRTSWQAANAAPLAIPLAEVRALAVDGPWRPIWLADAESPPTTRVNPQTNTNPTVPTSPPRPMPSIDPRSPLEGKAAFAFAIVDQSLAIPLPKSLPEGRLRGWVRMSGPVNGLRAVLVARFGKQTIRVPFSPTPARVESAPKGPAASGATVDFPIRIGETWQRFDWEWSATARLLAIDDRVPWQQRRPAAPTATRGATADTGADPAWEPLESLEIRLEAVSTAPPDANGISGRLLVDALSLAVPRSVRDRDFRPATGEVPTRDRLTLWTGEERFGLPQNLSPMGVRWKSPLGTDAFDWTIARAWLPRRRPVTLPMPLPIPTVENPGITRGWQVRLTICADDDLRDTLTGPVQSISATHWEIAHLSLGVVRIPISRIERITWLGVRAERWLERTPIHLGRVFDGRLEPPEPVGTFREWAFDWNDPAPPTLEILVGNLAGPEDSPAARDAIRQKIGLTEVRMNGNLVGTLNSFVGRRSRVPTRIRIPINPAWIRPEANRLRISGPTEAVPGDVGSCVIHQIRLIDLPPTP